MGAAGGSAHGGASPPAYSAGSGCPPGPKARVPPGRLLSDLMLRLLASLSPFVALRFLPLPCVRFSPLRSSSLSRGVAPPFAFFASFPFLPLPCVQFSPVLSTSFPIPATQGLFHSPYARVSLQLLSRSPLPCVQFLRSRRCSAFTPTDAPALSPISFRISVPPPRLRGSVIVARESRRSALAPLPRSGKVHRAVTGS